MNAIFICELGVFLGCEWQNWEDVFLAIAILVDWTFSEENLRVD